MRKPLANTPKTPFLAFESYDASRSGAEAEATLVVQQVETVLFLPKGAAAELTGELVCYGRSVAGIEWDTTDSQGHFLRPTCQLADHYERPRGVGGT